MAENFAVFDEATANDLLATMAAIKDGGLLDPKQDETKRGLDGRLNCSIAIILNAKTNM